MKVVLISLKIWYDNERGSKGDSEKFPEEWTDGI